MNANITIKPISDLPRRVYTIFDMAGKEDDYKAFSYLTRLNESLKDRVEITGRILGSYRGPRLNQPYLKARSFWYPNTSPHRKGLGRFFRAIQKKLKSATTYFWFSSFDAMHYHTLHWMKNWTQPDAKAVFFVQSLDAGLKLVELTFLYSKVVPNGMIVVLLGTQDFKAEKLRLLAKWGVQVLIDGSDYSASTQLSLQNYRSLHFHSIHEMPLRSRRVPCVNWNDELAGANLIQRNPEKVLFVRPDWMKCGSATTFGKLGTLFRDRGAILIDVALQPYRVPYDQVTVEKKLAEVESDISPSFHFNLRRGSRIYALLAIAMGYVQTRPRTVAGFMPIFYKQCVTPAVVRKLIADAGIDYIYVNHYFSLPVAKRLCGNRPLFLDTHDIQSLNFVSHEYHRHTRMRAAPFSACLQEELRIIDQADRVTMVSRDEIELVREHRPQSDFFYYIPIPLLPTRSQAVNEQRHEKNTSVKLLIVASRNPANERSLNWFLNKVWPFVVKTRAHLEIVGGISQSFSGNSFQNVTFLGMVDDIGHAYQQADVVVLPITNGGGIAIKTLEAIQYGKPIVATRHALRGLPLAVSEILPGWLAEGDLMADLSKLVSHKEARQQRIEQVHQVQDILTFMKFDEQMHAKLNLMRAAGRGEVAKRGKRIMRYVVVTPASPGSKGDEGILRGCLNVLMNATDIVVLNSERSPLWSDTLDKEPRLFKEQAGPFSEFHNSFTRNDLLILLGADVIDGTCGLEPSLQRVDLIKAASAAGAKVHVFCSFRSNVDNTIVTQLKQMQGVNFYLRDIHSLKRFKDQTKLEAEYFPDFFIFCDKKETALCRNVRHTLAEAKVAGKTLVGLNFSEHAFRSFSDVHDFANRKKYVADVLTSLSLAIENPYFLLISNDARRWDNFPPDSEYQNIAYEWLDANGYTLSTSLLNPDITYPEILNLLDGLDMVVSGRMHLALASFRNHVIPICYMGTGKGYSSVDKMRGAFDKFIGQTELVPSNTIELASAVKLLLIQHDILNERLKKSLLIIERESLEKKIQLRKRLQLDNDSTLLMNQYLQITNQLSKNLMEPKPILAQNLSREEPINVKKFANVLELTNVDRDILPTNSLEISVAKNFCSEPCNQLIQFGNSVTKWHNERHINALTCTQCAYVGFAPPSEEMLANYYSNQYEKDSDSWYNLDADYAPDKIKSRADNAVRLADKYITQGSPIIFEIGCAFGGTVFELRERGIEAFGSDLSSDAIYQGRGKGNSFIFDGLADTALRALGKKATLIYSYHALEHIPDPVSFLTSLKPYLADEAILEFRVPNGAYIRAWFEGFEKWDWFAFPDHLHMFTPHSILCLAEHSGYQILSVTSNACGEPIEHLTALLKAHPEFAMSSSDQLRESFLENMMLMSELRFILCQKDSKTADLFKSEIDLATKRCRLNRDFELLLKSDVDLRYLAN